MRVANLRHTNHLLQQSDSSYSKPNLNQWGDRSFGTFDGEEEKLTDDDYDDII